MSRATRSLRLAALTATLSMACAAGSTHYAVSAASPSMAAPMAAPASMSESAPADSDGVDEAPAMARPAPPSAPPPPPAAPGRAMPAINRATTNTGPAGNTGNGNANPAQPANTTAASPAPMLIYTADLDLQTAREDVVPTIDRIVDAATELGGYLVRRTDTSVQVRIPSATFRDGVRRVETFGEVLHRAVSAQDVSEEFRDLEVRLQNLRAVRRRLEEFLARAGSMADALQVERELERVTREIDTIEGRMRFFAARVAFSLVTVNVHARTEQAVIVGPPIPPRRAVELPVEWFRRLGLERLLNTRE